MAEYDERYGAWRDMAGDIHYNEGDANVANQSGGQSSSSSYNPVDLNSPEYNRQYSDYSANDYSGEITQVIKQSIEEDSRNRELTKLGYNCLNKGDYQGALNYFSQLQNRQGVWYNSGMVYLKMGDYDNAIDVFSKAIHNGQLYRADEHFAILSLAARGDIYLHRKQREQAVADYKNACKYRNRYDNNDHVVERLLKIGKDYEKEGNGNKAIDILNVLIEPGEDGYSPLNLDAYLMRGDLYAKKGEEENAITDYKAVADISYEYELYWKKYGELYKESALTYEERKSAALNALAENGVEYTPKIKKKTAKKSSTHTAIQTAQSSTGIKGGRIVSGLVLGAVCGFLGIVGIGVLTAMATGNTGMNIEKRYVFMGTAIIAAIFTLVWYKRKWLWIILFFAFAALGGYIIIGAPGLNRAVETVVPAEQPE